ncbi:hypothetical protein AB204_12915 [Xenorhabdus khoisanae]|uniref:Uncharacterized protein n=1 Tax=Xenorhabdus khoisanae TaxID=880157 RepID=A0A0J5INB8_9GAMM|nr:hypothetical protein [Xenorhabdus khoisanae]KMJ44715.1 hypothetical protein AB204_12915 [Xenorhabdus khoisanae]
MKTRFKSYEDRLFISCLAFYFNKKEREFLFDKLGLEYYESKITYILSKLPEDIGNELKVNLNILSLGEG